MMVVNKQISLISLPTLAYLVLCIVWGTTYYAVLAGLKGGFPPFIMGSCRFLIAGIIILLIALFKNQLTINFQFIWKNALLGSIMMGGGQGFIFWAEKYVPSGLAAVIEATLPLWFIILDNRNRANYLKSKGIIAGLILGFTGIILLFVKQLGSISAAGSLNFFYGLVALIAACICWVTSSLYYSKNFKDTSLLSGLPWQLFGGMLCCAIIASLSGEWHSFRFYSLNANAWLAVLYLAVAGSVCAFVAYHWLLRQWPAAIVGTYAYINPVIAVLIGYFAAAEKIDNYQLAGMVLIIISAIIANRFKAHLMSSTTG